jgi:hypothetical protein
METKEELVNNIKEWIKVDTDITKLQADMKERKLMKKQLTESLMNTMKKNQIDCFDINGGSLIYKKSKIKKPINTKTLLGALQNYYKSTPDKAEELTKFILDNREETVKETIKRKIDK